MEIFDFEVALLDAPLTVPEYARGHIPHGRTVMPRPDLHGTGIWMAAYLTGESGRRHNGCPVFDDTVGQTQTLPVYRLVDGDMSGPPPELWSRPDLYQMHPFRYSETEHEVRFCNDQTEVVVQPGRWTWSDE